MIDRREMLGLTLSTAVAAALAGRARAAGKGDAAAARFSALLASFAEEILRLGVTARLFGPNIQATWSGQGPGVFRIGGRATSLTKALADGEVLKLHYRVDQPPRKAVILALRCEPAERCGMAPTSGLNLTETFRSAGTGTWKTLSIPLVCLKKLGATLSSVTAPLALESAGPFGISLDDVRITRQNGATASCPPNT